MQEIKMEVEREKKEGECIEKEKRKLNLKKEKA
jgi:hypothetical protein